MNKVLKHIFVILSFYLSIGSAFAVQIVSSTDLQQAESQETLKTIMVTIFGGMAFILATIFFFFIVLLIILKIQKKLRELTRRQKDFLYSNFQENLNFCHYNKDGELKRRRKRTLGLTWYRRPVFAATENGLVKLGDYHGETNKKENFYFIALYNKMGMFKFTETVIIIPQQIKHLVKKSYIDGKKVLTIECEGIDEIGSTDYYFTPLVKNEKDGKFLDFSEHVRKNFTGIVTYRNILKEELQAHRNAVIDSVESNATLQFKRRGQ